MENKQVSKEREYEGAGLNEAVDALFRRKRLIAGLIVIAVAVVIFFSYRTYYQADAVIEIGTLLNFSGESRVPVEMPLTIEEKINKDVYGAAARAKTGIRNAPEIKAANMPGTNIVYLSAKSFDSDQAKFYLSAICNEILAEHKKKTEAQKEIIRNEALNIGKNLDGLKSYPDLWQTTGRNLNLDKSKLEKQLADSELSLAAVSDTVVVRQLAVSVQGWAGIALNAFLAAVFALLSGVFLALALDWWANAKK